MSKTWLILDMHYLAWRAFYTTGDLGYEDRPTGVVYGLLQYIGKVGREFNTGNYVFTFDHGKSIREGLGCGYKEKRRQKEKELTKDETKRLIGMRNQVDSMKKKYLPDIGFKNVFYQKGYEGDDLIASVVKYSLPKGDDAIIVSADKDLYQLLDHHISIWDPYQEKMTHRSTFIEKYGLQPKQWVFVKAIAGCNTDGVEGIKGVGEKTAIKYLNNEVTEKIRYKIIESKEILDRNLKLVKLPYPGVRRFELQPDEFNRKEWIKVINKLGMRSLKDAMPLTRPARKVKV